MRIQTFTAVRPRAVAMMLSAVLLTVFLVTLGTQSAHAATMTESESNGSTASADVVPVGTTITGSTSVANSSSDSDYYAVNVPSDSRLGVNLRFPTGLGADTAYNLTVYTSGGKVLYDFDIAGDQNDGTWLSSQATFTPKGLLYVRVQGYSGRPSWGKAYQLTVKATPGIVETEFNDSTATADALPLGTTVTASTLLGSTSADGDYYAINVPSDGRLGINLRFPSGLGADTAYNVTVYTSAGKVLYDYQIAGDQNDGAWLNSQATFTPKGLLYVRVQGYSSRPSWGKAYQLTVKATPGIVETEFNDSTATADTLPLGTTVTASTLLGSSSSDSDYYAINVAAATNLVINFTFPAGLGSEKAYEVKVYSPAGSALYSYTLIGNGAGAANGTWLRGQTITVPKGRIFIRVLGYSSRPSWGQAYTLSASYAWAAAPPT
ncbi:hypothetical protein [Cryobacterium soli]|uniref:hypothetical protein n=1 Tax=Cryobacterium soli TaxID=2220095 RepID=UPI000E76EF84|nr:hypothetical protein [Cryobacterium soli]